MVDGGNYSRFVQGIIWWLMKGTIGVDGINHQG